jgi:hypothetical protein
MSSRISAAVAGASLLLTGTAMAQQASVGPYVSGAIGQSIFWDTDLAGGGEFDYDYLALFLSGALGYRLSPNLRAEAELLYESADIENANTDVEVLRTTISGYFDFNPILLAGRSMAPYAGGGLGFANVEFFDDELELTWHAEAGASIPIADRIEFVPGIRFEYISVDENFIDDESIWVTQLRAGFRYSF